MSKRFEGKVAVITGGASGIGAATARRLADEGASVLIVDRDDALGAETVRSIGSGAWLHSFDITDEGAWDKLVQEAEAQHGRVDILVNSAGIAGWGTIEDTSVEAWRRTLDVNLLGTFLGCRAAVATMRRGGGGSIINISSAMGVKADPNQLAYCASKAAVIQLTRSVALHCGNQGYNIRCNAILPGAVDTPLLATAGAILGGREQLEEAMSRAHPIGRMGLPEEIAGAVAFLASDDASFVTASAYAVDGGMCEI